MTHAASTAPAAIALRTGLGREVSHPAIPMQNGSRATCAYRSAKSTLVRGKTLLNGASARRTHATVAAMPGRDFRNAAAAARHAANAIHPISARDTSAVCGEIPHSTLWPRNGATSRRAYPNSTSPFAPSTASSGSPDATAVASRRAIQRWTPVISAATAAYGTTGRSLSRAVPSVRRRSACAARRSGSTSVVPFAVRDTASSAAPSACQRFPPPSIPRNQQSAESAIQANERTSFRLAIHATFSVAAGCAAKSTPASAAAPAERRSRAARNTTSAAPHAWRSAECRWYQRAASDAGPKSAWSRPSDP
ncbi:MAG: hypothetical protein HMLKMBBP_03034 [Planctomycetes bacterium]|nr:hypothetical protein [Planctomycetota bacterium]